MWRWTPSNLPNRLSGSTQVHLVMEDTIIATTGPYAAPACGNGTVVSLRKSDHAVVWQVTNPWPLTRAARAGGLVLLLYNCGDLVAVQASTGSTAWAKSWSAREPATAASTQVVVFVRSNSSCCMLAKPAQTSVEGECTRPRCLVVCGARLCVSQLLLVSKLSSLLHGP